MGTVMHTPPSANRSGPSSLWRFVGLLLAPAAILLAMACSGGGGGGGTTVAAPVATSLTASSTTPAFGATFTLTPVYSEGTGTIDNSVTCPATGVASSAITANWAGARVFTLTVTNSANVTATTTATVTPQVVSVGAISPASPTVGTSSDTTFTATVTGGATNNVTWSSTAGTWASNVWTAPAAPVSGVTITATSVDDPTKTATTTVTVVTVVPPPVATSLTASSTSPLFGDTFTLTPVYSGGTGTITFPSGTVTCPATGVASGAITANWAGARLYTLTVTNSVPTTATTTRTVTPQVVSVGAISPATPAVTVSTTAIFTATASGGVTNTVTWTSTAGNWASNVWTAPATPGDVTITATSVADPTKTNTTTVNVVAAPTITSFTNAGLAADGSGVELTAVFAGGTALVDQGVGAMTSGVAKSVGATLSDDQSYILTVTNLAGTSVRAATTVAVLPVFTTQPAPQVLSAPSPATFNVAISSVSPVTLVTWQKLIAGTWTTVQSGLLNSYTTTALANSDNGALFRVIAANAYGSTTSTTAGVNQVLPVTAGGTTIDLILMPAGTYTMGETETVVGSEPRALTAHSVTIANPFYISKTLITQTQWLAIMGSNPSISTGNLAQPVDNVSFDDITTATTGFLAQLNAAVGGGTFRLPSEAEFEFACRAGSSTNYYFGDYDSGYLPDVATINKYMWSVDNSGGETHPVGQKLPNAWGLFDMIGQVWQVCADDWHASYDVPAVGGVSVRPDNGAAWVDSPRATERSFRGGALDVGPQYGQSKVRGPYLATTKDWNTGFRLVLPLP